MLKHIAAAALLGGTSLFPMLALAQADRPSPPQSIKPSPSTSPQGARRSTSADPKAARPAPQGAKKSTAASPPAAKAAPAAAPAQASTQTECDKLVAIFDVPGAAALAPPLTVEKARELGRNNDQETCRNSVIAFASAGIRPPPVATPPVTASSAKVESTASAKASAKTTAKTAKAPAGDAARRPAAQAQGGTVPR